MLFRSFHEKPAWHTIKGATLKARVACLASAPWGGSTNLQSSFDLILGVAKEFRVPQSQLPQTLFCFSDMQFDAAMGHGWMKTNFQVLQGKFAAAGYKLPSIVFWNVNGKLNKDAPIECDQAGCALMSGFSASLLQVFLRAPIAADPASMSLDDAAQNPLHPLAIMMDSVKGYEVVVDETER